jgi:hypothetical protein
VKPTQHVTTDNTASIIRRSFSKAFTKYDTEKGFDVTGIYYLNDNVLMEIIHVLSLRGRTDW